MQEFLDFGDGFDRPTAQPLAERYGEPPFSVLHAGTGRWMAVERDYRRMIASGEGRAVRTYGNWKNNTETLASQSIFSARLARLAYDWFSPVGGTVLDPFAGGSVRGIVAGMCGMRYTGIDIRQEQVDEDLRQVEQARDVLIHKPDYICGDSRIVLDKLDGQYDLLFSCPPYADLEVYSDLEGDVSNMRYGDFLVAYADIIRKSCAKLRDGGFAVWVVGEVRDPRSGALRGFVPDTVRAFQDAGMDYYDEIILENCLGTAPRRTKQFATSRKIVKTHQNILVFTKGRPVLTEAYRRF